MTDSKDLIALLREAIESGMAKCYDDTFREAADRIAALEAEVVRLRAFEEVFDALEAKLEWEGSPVHNNWDEWRRRYERFETAIKAARRARAALEGQS